MSVGSYDAVAEKVLLDLELAIKKYPNIDEFYIIPTPEEENKNSSPVIRGENTLGLESWIVTHIYLYAHHQIMEKNNYKMQNLSKVVPCLMGVALLNPEMPTVWSRRRELIISNKLSPENEFRLTRMALSRKPKCNDALAHRRWIITEMMKGVRDKSTLLTEELKLSEMIANRYHSNYHAWSHRMWSLEHLVPDSPHHPRKKPRRHSSPFGTLSLEQAETMTRPVARNDHCALNNCETCRIYFQELENNFSWVCSHVSDHSGLHFRKFLIGEILSLTLDHRTGAGTEQGRTCTNSQCNLIADVLVNGRLNLSEFLGSFEPDGEYKMAAKEYLSNLERELTFFDMGMFLIVTELKSNHSLCAVFPNHEALWCYRRYLIFMYKQLMESLDCEKNGAEDRSFLHLDKNGVPSRKDCKYENAGDSDVRRRRSGPYGVFYRRLVSNEEAIIASVNGQDDHVKALVSNYSHWLKRCFSENEKFL